jgi:hypothetical protein
MTSRGWHPVENLIHVCIDAIGLGLNPLRVVEVLDWCHGAHHVSVALET